ncbi:hypothetical protein [Bradyrhizobium sp.]|uniref:hypothetical protein n=1 Tax=Bradyrhizobium sp. TaxID=376 RepID=UPI003BAF265B
MPTNGRKLFTLRDAATYITSLPKADQQAAPWQIATEMLLLVAEHGGDTMMPRIAMIDDRAVIDLNFNLMVPVAFKLTFRSGRQ